MPIPTKNLAIASMVWSVISGAAGLAGIWLIQQSSSDGHPPPFDWGFLAFYLSVEVLLALTLLGILRDSRWSGLTLSVLVNGTVLGVFTWVHRDSQGHGAQEFLIYLVLLWLLPWAFTMQRYLTSGRRRRI